MAKEVAKRLFISAASDSKLGSIIATALVQQHFPILYAAQDTIPSEIWVEQIRERLNHISAAILIVENLGDVSDIDDKGLTNETLAIALRRIQELELSLLVSESNLKMVKEYLTRIHRILLATDKQLEQHKVKVGGVDRLFVSELIDGFTELVEQAVTVHTA